MDLVSLLGPTEPGRLTSWFLYAPHHASRTSQPTRTVSLQRDVGGQSRGPGRGGAAPFGPGAAGGHCVRARGAGLPAAAPGAAGPDGAGAAGGGATPGGRAELRGEAAGGEHSAASETAGRSRHPPPSLDRATQVCAEVKGQGDGGVSRVRMDRLGCSVVKWFCPPGLCWTGEPFGSSYP